MQNSLKPTNIVKELQQLLQFTVIQSAILSVSHTDKKHKNYPKIMGYYPKNNTTISFRNKEFENLLAAKIWLGIHCSKLYTHRRQKHSEKAKEETQLLKSQQRNEMNGYFTKMN